MKVRYLLFTVWFFLACVANAQVTHNQSIQKIRLWTSPEKTRLVFDVSRDVNYKVFRLAKPNRLVIDIEQAGLLNRLPEIEAHHPYIAKMRVGNPDDAYLRFVLDLKKDIQYRDFSLSPNELYGHRLIVDLFESEKNQAVNKKSTPSSPVEQTSDRLSSTSKTVKKENKVFTVAIDAGHGGEDPGAIGYRGSREKKITLLIAKELKRQIDRDPSMRAFLVRTGDYYIKLKKRRDIARKQKADIFLSIHADAFKKKSARGLSVFALSQRGATSAMAQALANKENASDTIGGVNLSNKDTVLQGVLVNLSMNHTIKESLGLGKLMIKELSKVGKMHSRKVEQAGFAVLKSADTPSLLIETGFITNPQEERNLRSKRYRKKLASAMYAAVKQYSKNTAFYSVQEQGSGTVIKKIEKKYIYHTVVRGDSLSKIAQKYASSVRAIQAANGLRSSVAPLGRELKIPVSVGHKSTTQPSAAKPKRKQDKRKKYHIHVVQSGEFLAKISAQYNVTISAIKRANNLRRDRVLVGQKLRIPIRNLPREARQKKTKPIVHIVRRGDTLSGLAKKYAVSIHSIKQKNGLKRTVLFRGQKLIIPQ